MNNGSAASPVRPLAGMVLLLTLASCGGESLPTIPPDVTAASIAVTGSASITLASGSSATIVATTRNKSGVILVGQSVSWATADPTVALVSATGVVTAARVGQTTLTASTGSISAPAVAITVIPGTAATLALRMQPVGAASGAPLAMQPIVEVRDAAGNVVTSAAAAITASIATGGGTLTGTTTIDAIAGIATFTNLVITGASGVRTLAFVAPPLAPTASSALDIATAQALTARKLIATGNAYALRLARDPVSGALFVLRSDGTVRRVTITATGSSIETVYSPAITGLPVPQGLAFGQDGTLYLVGDDYYQPRITGMVRRGVRTSATSDTRVWSSVAHSVPYPTSIDFDHRFNGIAVSPDGKTLFVNSGARTDHGEVEDNHGLFPGMREIPLTALILRLPANGADILLPNDDAALRAGGYVFARGVRNTFDLAISADGELFGGDNSGDRDDADELNWIQEGRHYGFPWRMGTNDTPQQFPGYDPLTDRLVNHAYPWETLFRNDSTYPARPAGITFTDPIRNTGPDANSFRDPLTGIAHKASDLGLSLGTFTPHRSPLGLVFDTRNELPDRFRGAAFILGWTAGYTTSDGPTGPFLDASEDLIQLVLTHAGDSYRTTARRLVCGFHGPVDAEILNGKLYILEFESGAIWEIMLPTGSEAARADCVTLP